MEERRDIAAVGALLGDPARARLLTALTDGRALPAGVLAREAGVSASTASEHLRRLLDGGLLAVRSQGRHRYYRLADARVARLLEQMSALAPVAPVRSLREDTRAHALRQARYCYDHLAGRLGVSLMQSLIDQGALSGGDGHHHLEGAGADRLSAPGRDVDYELTDRGERLLAVLGIDVRSLSTGRRPLVRYCVDWTEQRHHLAGALGAALAARLIERDWVRRRSVPRAVTLTDAGIAGLAAAGIRVTG